MNTVALAGLMCAAAAGCGAQAAAAAPGPQPLALAVVGDSDSHGYHDTLAFPPGSAQRGGAYRASTWQWTEVLAALRPQSIDLGPRAATGSSGTVARLREWVGLAARAPAKRDHLYNFAASGQGCEHLMQSGSRQVPRLLRLMAEEPARWRGGAVVIRIGVNTFGTADDLEALARNPVAPAVVQKIDGCLREITQAVQALRQQHPQTGVVLVGIFDNSHWARYTQRWQSRRELAAIAQGLDRFDAGLKRLQAQNDRVLFFDDRAWFAQLWGTRDAQGRAAYRSVTLPAVSPVTQGVLAVNNTAGDHPSHATLADGHAGTVWNALWAQALVRELNQHWQWGVPPIRDDEIRALVAPQGVWPR